MQRTPGQPTVIKVTHPDNAFGGLLFSTDHPDKAAYLADLRQAYPGGYVREIAGERAQ